MKIVAKFNVQDVSFSITETELSNCQNSPYDVDDKNINKKYKSYSKNKWNEKSKENKKSPENNGKSFL